MKYTSTYLAALLFCLCNINTIQCQNSLIDTVYLTYETMDTPPGGIFDAYYGQGEKLFGVADDGVYLSMDKGSNWEVFLGDTVQNFVANDSTTVFSTFDSSTVGFYVLNPQNEIIAQQNLPFTEVVGTEPNGLTYFVRNGFYGFDVVKDSIISYIFQNQLWSVLNGVMTPLNVVERNTRVSSDFGKTFQVIEAVGLRTGVYQDTVAIFQGNQIVRSFDSYEVFDTIPILLPADLNSSWINAKRFDYENDCFILYYLNNGYQLVQYQTCDRGITWTGQILPEQFDNARAIKRYANQLYVSTNYGLFRCALNDFTQVDIIYTGILSSPKIGYYTIIGESELIANSLSGATIRTVDVGENWTVMNNGLGNGQISRVKEIEDELHVLVNNDNFWWTKDTADNWTLRDDELPYASVFVDKHFGQYFAGPTNVIYKWRVDEDEWDSITGNICCHPELHSSGNRLYLITSQYQFYSDDEGENWEEIDLEITDLIAHGDTLLAVADDKLYRTLDGGDFWAVVNLNTDWVMDIHQENNQIVVVGKYGKIFTSQDWGASWLASTIELPITYSVRSHLEDSLLFYSNNDAAFVTKDFGQSWSLLNNMTFSHLEIFDGQLIIKEGYLYTWKTDVQLLKNLLNLTPETRTIIVGKTYFDVNGNENYDNADINASFRPLEFRPGPYYTFSDANGNYKINLPAGNYDLITKPIAGYASVPDTILEEVELLPNDTSYFDFGYLADPDYLDLGITFDNLNPARPGFPLNIKVNVENLSTNSVADAKIQFIFPSDQINFF